MTDINHQINASIQIVPVEKDISADGYALIDTAIHTIIDSGLEYLVTPMETIIQGPYEQVMEVFRKAQETCLSAGADELVVHIRLHIKKQGDINFSDKTAKFS